MDIFGRALNSVKQSVTHVTDSIRQLLHGQNNSAHVNEVQGSVTHGHTTNNDWIPLTPIPPFPPSYNDVPTLQRPATSYSSIYSRFYAVAGSALSLPDMGPPAYISHDTLPTYSRSVGEPPRGSYARQTWRGITGRITQPRLFGPLPAPRFTLAIPPRSHSAGPAAPAPSSVVIQYAVPRSGRLGALPARWKLAWVVGGGVVLTGLGVVFWIAEQSWEKKKGALK